MKSHLILLASSLAVFVLSSAPSTQSARVYARYSKPLRSVSIDLATGTVERGPTILPRAAGTTIDFDNNDLSGFVGVDSGNGFCEWFDAATKGFANNQSDLMAEITFAYCSAMASVGSGGPGGSVKLGFYEGYQAFGGAPTTGVSKFTLTGLPANSSSSSFFGGFNCYFASVTFGTLVSFADGPIGYSWKFLGVGTSGRLGGTWPFLACVSSCSGTLPGGGAGMLDVIDEYCPPGTLRSTFTFGTTSGMFTSMSMDIREASDLAATHASYNAAATPNPDTLVATSPVLGAIWTATLTRATSGVPGPLLVSIRAARVPLANGFQGPAPLPVGAGGRILVSGAPLATLPGVHDGLHGSVSAVLPLSFALLGRHFAAQATVVGGGVKVSSAVEGTIGTF